jgi:hypothetical protein
MAMAITPMGLIMVGGGGVIVPIGVVIGAAIIMVIMMVTMPDITPVITTTI